MTRKPEFITFTGADDWSDIGQMMNLSSQYPIEWGVLFSLSRQGIDPRYPGGEAQSRLLWSELRMSAHLCGGYAHNIMESSSLGDARIPVDLGYFKRIQINHREPRVDQINKFRKGWGPRCIAQCRGAFPKDTSVDWLFDQSGGRGQEPEAFPFYPDRLVGYAGGIGPDNVLSVIERIDANGPYWIDMESKIRTNNRLDLGLCRRVCELVYGK